MMHATEPIDNAISNLCQRIRERENRAPITFKEFIELSAENPGFIFRDIFRIFYDMVNSYVGDGVEEYPDDPESINYVYYDCSKLFVEGADHPFFCGQAFCQQTNQSYLLFQARDPAEQDLHLRRPPRVREKYLPQ